MYVWSLPVVTLDTVAKNRLYLRNRWEACEKVVGVVPGKIQKATFQLYEKYTNLFAIDLSIVSRLHRENILNTLITMTEYLPMSRSKKACFTI